MEFMCGTGMKDRDCPLLEILFAECTLEHGAIDSIALHLSCTNQAHEWNKESVKRADLFVLSAVSWKIFSFNDLVTSL